MCTVGGQDKCKDGICLGFEYITIGERGGSDLVLGRLARADISGTGREIKQGIIRKSTPGKW